MTEHASIPPMVPAPTDEFATRRARLCAALELEGLAAAVFTMESNIRYLTGLATPSFASRSRPYQLLVAPASRPIMLVARAHVPHTHRSTGIEDVRGFDGFEPEAIELGVAALRETVGPAARVAFELGSEMHLAMSHAGFGELVRQSGIEVRDIAPTIWRLRATKSPWEIGCLERVGAIAGRAFDGLIAAARAGATQRDLHQEFVREAMASGADKVGYFAIHSGRGEDRRPNAPATDRRLERGDVVWVDAGVVAGGYWSDITRMIAIGDPGTERHDAYRTVHEITAQVIDQVRPGVPVAHLVDVARSLLAALGRVPGNASRIGHGLGLDLTEPPSILDSDQTVLEPGMVIALEPAIGFEAGYFVAEENLLVTDQGHRLLSPPGPDHLPRVD